MAWLFWGISITFAPPEAMGGYPEIRFIKILLYQ